MVETLGLETDEAACQKIDDALATCIAKPDMSMKGSGPKKKRAPTEYNLFMKDMIMNLRLEHPEIDKKELMSMGAKEWQLQKLQKVQRLEQQEKQEQQDAADKLKLEKKSKK